MAKPDQLSAAERQSGQRKRRGRRGSPSPFEAVWEGDSEMAAEARALLRDRGDNGVVEGPGDLSGNQMATLKFAVVGIVLVVVWWLLMVITHSD